MDSLLKELQRTFDTNHTRPVEWRVAQLEALQRGIAESHDEICKALFADLHRPEVEALQAEVLSPIGEIQFMLEHIVDWMEPKRVPIPAMMAAEECFHVYKPKGVVLIISPFNFPFNLTFNPLIGAIAAGNCAVIKPSEMTPESAKVIQHIIERCLDPKAFKVVQGAVKETSQLLQLPFDHFFYTGNSQVGRLVMEAAAKHLSTVTLELGGKSPVYIHEDANLGVAARRLVNAKFLNAGQMCITADYVLVHHKVEEAFVEEVKRTIIQFFPKPELQMSRVITDKHFARIHALLEQQPREAVISVIGKQTAHTGRFIPPTLVLNPKLDSALMLDEIFGPVLPVLGVTGLDEALQVVRKVYSKPLAAYVFTETPAVADKFLDQVHSGGGCINAVAVQLQNPNLAFGGSGPSGIGSYRGFHSFTEFSHRQSVVRHGTNDEITKMYPPYHAKLAAGLKSML